jgi:hypothetical protein
MLFALIACNADDDGTLDDSAAAAMTEDTDTYGSRYLAVTPNPVSLPFSGDAMDLCEASTSSDVVAQAKTEATLTVRNVASVSLSFALNTDEYGPTCVEEAPRVSVYGEIGTVSLAVGESVDYPLVVCVVCRSGVIPERGEHAFDGEIVYALDDNTAHGVFPLPMTVEL